MSFLQADEGGVEDKYREEHDEGDRGGDTGGLHVGHQEYHLQAPEQHGEHDRLIKQAREQLTDIEKSESEEDTAGREQGDRYRVDPLLQES